MRVQPVGVGVAMVGRDRERTELGVELDDVRRGFGRAAMLVGGAGMGKSMLADWLVVAAGGRGLRVARAACSMAGLPPLWPWRQALRGIAPDVSWQSDGPIGHDRLVLSAAVVEAIADASRERPLLVVLEDVHWSDPASLLVTRAVADTVAALPVMLLLTCRDDLDEAVPQVRAGLADLPTRVRRVLLPPLDERGVARLAAGVLGREMSERELRELCNRTGGNPFFVYEVTRLLAAHGPAGALVVPPGVREVLQRRVARLTQACTALLMGAAVAAETSAELIEAELLGVPTTSAAPLLDEAVAAGLIDVTAGRHRFRHVLIREVLEHELSSGERARQHEIVATALEAEPDAEALAPRLAHHWSRSAGPGAREKATVWALRAARDAMTGFGFEAAAAYFAQALTDPAVDRVAVSIELGEALQLSGNVVTAREMLIGAARQAGAANRATELAQAALALGGGLAGFEVPILDEQQAELLRQADAALAADALALRAAVRGRLSVALAAAVPLAERVALAEDAVQMARRSGDVLIECAVLAAYCDAIAGPDYVTDRLAAARRMLQLTRATSMLREHASVLLARRLLVVAHLETGDLAAAAEQAAAYERVARRLTVPRYAWLPEIWRAMRALLAGDPDAALRHAASAEEIGRRSGSVNAELMAFTVRMQAHLDRGTITEFVPAIHAIFAAIGDGLPAMYAAAPARALLAAGQSRHAESVLRAFRSGDAQAMPKDAEWLESHWAMADIAISLGDRAAAASLFEALRPYEELWAVDGIGGAVFGVVAEQLGRLAGYLGRADEALAYLGAARAAYESADAAALRERTDALRDPPTSAEPSGGRLRRDGQVWFVEWRGRQSTLPDSKGVRDLAVLLARPGQAVPALDLLEAAGGPSARSAGGDLGPVLDDAARRAYRRRLADLDTEIDRAEADADLGRLERLRAEQAVIAGELAHAFGLGGRPRLVGDPGERARKAVTMRIRSAMAAVEKQDGALARHLRNTVRTGRLCSYQPEDGVAWQLTMSGGN